MTTSTAPEQLITADASLKGALPSDFIYAASTASYQIEGGHDADGKGLSNWDVYLADKENGNDACGSYTLWKEDIKLLKALGCNAYRFSVSWPRVKPIGGANDPVNEAGIAYYSNLIDALIDEGIEPVLTLFHWDLPDELDKQYGGFESPKIVDDFVSYAKLLFERFGDRVKYWITINEPLIYTLLNGLAMKKETWTDDVHAAYSRHLLLCHGRTVDLYRREFQDQQKGQIAITLNMDMLVPLDDSAEAKAATQIGMDQRLGMYADPIYLGKFPQSCIDRFGADKLTFTDEEWAVVKGSNDYFGLNHYSTSYATGKRQDPATANARDSIFGLIESTTTKDGKPIGNKGQNGHPYDCAWGFRMLLQYIAERYTGPAGQKIYITENGFAVDGESEMTVEEQINDTQRQAFYAGYVREMVLAMRDDGIAVGGYMAWSLLDNLEWIMGYVPRFGLTVVDRSSPEFTRRAKDSSGALKRMFEYLIKK